MTSSRAENLSLQRTTFSVNSWGREACRGNLIRQAHSTARDENTEDIDPDHTA
jgi:hypothetical protein